MGDPIIVEPYNEAWPKMFNQLGMQMKSVLSTSALRIDHIGSTAVPGLPAKPILDIQISVVDLNNIQKLQEGLSELGFQFQQGNPDLTKRYFRETAGMSRTHIHVRELGSWSEQFNLLFRDYLRTNNYARDEYAKAKIELAKQYKNQREDYTSGKTEIVGKIMMMANQWSQEMGWKPGKAGF